MSLTPDSFTHAEYLQSEDVPAINAPATPNPALFSRAVLFGLGGAAAGGFIYAAFIGLTHINIGYLSILVAYLVAKAMTSGSRGQGGRWYQVAALCLTYLAVSAARAALLWWEVHRQGGHVALNAHNILLLTKYGLFKPFLSLKTSTGSAVLDLFILFIGLRAAWRMTSGIPGAVRHPFARP